jgi:putative oxidoreductase
MLLKFLGKHRDTGLLILRLGVGFAFIIHGLPKILGGPKVWHGLGEAMGHVGIHFLPIFWGFMAAITEGIGGVLLMIGAFYRPICLLLTFVMMVATLTLGWPDGPKEFSNKQSHPFKMAFVFLGLACVGPGRFSIDKD